MNAVNLSGLVAVVVRGGCSFSRKAQVVQAAGAAGMVVLNVDDEQELVTMTSDMPLANSAVRIPSLLLAARDSRLLLHAMRDAARQHRPSPVATLALDPAPPPPPPRGSAPAGASSEAQGGDGAPPEGPPAHDGVAPARSGSTRVDLLIPTTTHAFIKAHVAARGHDLQAVMEGLLEDERVPLMLMQVPRRLPPHQ